MSTFYFIVEQTMFFAIPLLVVAIGAMYSEKSGITNIALEGIMIIGAFCGITAMNIMFTFMSGQIVLILAIIVGGLTGMLYSAFHAWSSIKLMADQTISGTALNIIAAALCMFVARITIGSKYLRFKDDFFIDSVPVLGKIPVLGPMFFQNCYLTTFIGLLLFLILAFVMKRTRFGMRLSACGENPLAAASAGINVSEMRWKGVIISGFMGGAGGIIFVVPTSTIFASDVSGYGFLALAVLILGQWKAKGILPAAFFFGILKAIASSYSGIPALADMNLPSEVYKLIPYVLTIVVLAISSRRSKAPKALGIPYDDGQKGKKSSIRRKRIAIVALAVVFVCGSCVVAYCNTGSDSKTGVSRGYGGDIGLVVSASSSIDDKSFFQGAWEGIKSFCDDNGGITHKYYQCQDNSSGNVTSTARIAIKGGAKIVVCASLEEASTVYKLQDEYPDINFILIDEEPQNADGSDKKTGDNTLSVTFKEEESGFLAGYAAVMDGYRHLGFIGGKAVPSVIRYGYGFVAGMEQAASELGLQKGDVTMKYNYTGSFTSNPDTLAQASSWYNSGTEVIFACGGSMGNSVMKAAENTGGKTIGVDVDQSGESETVITSAMKNISKATALAIEMFYSGADVGGNNVRLGAEVNAVKLPMKTSRFETFSQEDYEKVFNRLKEGEFDIPDDTSASSADKLPTKIVEVKVIR